MINNLVVLIPEIFLIISICIILMIGVFSKNSYNFIVKSTIAILILTIILILNSNDETVIKIFSESFVSSKYTIFLKVLISLSSIFVINSSQIFIKENKISKFEYPIIILLSILGMFFMVSANDLILFYLGLELQSLSLYILASIDRENIKSTESGIKYFILSALSSGLLLYGCSLLYGFTGSTNFEIIGSKLTTTNVGAIFAMVFILVGLAFKISAVPFHMWTPDVYEGSPTSVTAFFATAPKIAGLGVLITFMKVPFSNIINEWQMIIIFISVASMILGAVAAIGQNNIKRLLAYSSIGHIGYALAGVATGTNLGYASALIYISIYTVMMIGIFSCIFLMKRDGVYTDQINHLSGISKKHPLYSISFLIILFSLAGIPPLGGFFAKFYVFMAVIENKMYVLAIIGLLTTVISAFYYLRIIKIIYFDEIEKPLDDIKDFNLTGTIFICCVLLLTYLLYPSSLSNIVEIVVN
tara:strand:- start:3243 stop:4658 length:1416 start_codon:yes stop_codon:yes gene_type:complete